jgi:membrane dipeptidase
MKSRSTWSRRGFLTAVAGTGSAMILDPWAAWAIGQPDPRVAQIVAATIGVDTHNHIDVPTAVPEVPGPAIDLAGEMKTSGLSAICATFAVDYQKLNNPGEHYYRFINALDSMDQQLKNNGIKRSLDLADIREAHKKHRPAIVQAVEGGHFLEGRIERVQEAYGRGLRVLGLLHDSDAMVPLGDVYTNPPNYGGLTDFGSQVIGECNRLGILIDLTHCSTDTVAAALKRSTRPVVFSHTGLDTQLGQDANMARMMRPRLISATEAKTIADAGGVIGVWTHLTDSPLEYAQHIRAMVDAAGIDHVCIGTDTKLTPAYRSPGSGGPRIGERTNLAWKDQQTGFYYTVVDAMLKTGFTADEIGKVGGGNFCRVFDAATAGH